YRLAQHNKITTAFRNKVVKLTEPQANWPFHPVKVWSRSGTFEAANRVLEFLLENSDLDSDWTDTEVTLAKRTRKPKDFQEPGADGFKYVGIFEKPYSFGIRKNSSVIERTGQL
ncbi:unnamed protein product, partial [Allacma fusca]